jgi:anti-sigma factor ChrR (cupin superfamily)
MTGMKVDELAFAPVLAPEPEPRLRAQMMELAKAPALPIDVTAYAWEELVPGVRASVVKDEPGEGFRAVLVWAEPGARHPDHRHHGEELIYVLQGGIKDHRGEYHAGDVCRSATGSVHSEEALPLGTCFCYVLYYGALEML